MCIACMATKTISLDEDAYNRLKNLKKGDESFSDIVKRIADEKSLLEVSGILSEEEAEELRKNVEELRERTRTETDQKAERLK